MKRSIALVLLGTAGTAAADSWISAELPTAVAVSDVQQETFRAGAMPAVGGCLAVTPTFSIGARLRAGVLRDGGHAATLAGDNRMDPSTGGLATVGLAGRLAYRGAFIELVAGGGVTGTDLVPAFELGAGYLFDFEHLAVGPSARYVRLQATTSDALGSADLVLIGVDLQLGHHARHAPRAHLVPPVARLEMAAVAPPTPEPAPAPIVPLDHDRVIDQAASCADLVEFLDAEGGCGPGAAIDVVGDRIILDDRVLFDTDHAHVHAEGRAMIRAIVAAAAKHPEWQTITIEGHADLRGNDAWNQQLSELRAERTRDTMVRAGFPAERLHTVGYGRTRPRDPGLTLEAHHRNRRVEFVIDRAPHRQEAL
jgi:peptidoglycan-associated lipoprotein